MLSKRRSSSEALAEEVVEDLQTALAQFAAIGADLGAAPWAALPARSGAC